MIAATVDSRRRSCRWTRSSEPLSEVRDYDELVAALLTRMNALNITMETVILLQTIPANPSETRSITRRYHRLQMIRHRQSRYHRQSSYY
jgi:hypothetical protein